MFFDDIGELESLARQNGTSLFVVPDEVEVKIPGAIVLEPEEKSVITIEQVRRMQENVQKRQSKDFTVVIRPADGMDSAAANALLKTLEQPGEKVHFVLITERPTQLLPTILSRAAVYYLRQETDLAGAIRGSEEKKELARKLLKGEDLVGTATAIAKAKSGEKKRRATETLEIAIEMAYKSFYKTGNVAFLRRIAQLTTAYRNIAIGGNIKLQIVANLC